MTRIARTMTAALLVGAAALLVGCSSGASSPPATGGTTSTSTASSSAASAPARSAVTATEKEYSIALSTTAFAPGTYTFTIQNQGTFPHNLNVKGPGVAGQISSTVAPGGSAQLTVILQSGSYELWCSIDGHQDRGMDLTVQVS